MIGSIYQRARDEHEKLLLISIAVLLFLTILPIAMCLPLPLRHVLQILAMLGFLTGIILHGDRKMVVIYLALMAVFFLQTFQVWRFNHKGLAAVAFNVFTDWSFVFYGLIIYRLKDSRYQKYLLNILIAVITVTAVTTLIGLFFDPLAVRELGRADTSASYTGVTGRAFAAIKWGYRLRNIAGWNQLYAMAFFIPCILFVYKKTKQWIHLLAAVLCMLCVLKAQLTFALLLTAMMTFFSFVKPSLTKKGLLIEGGILVAAALFLDDLILLASNLLAKTGMSMLPNKLRDFYLLLQGTDTGSALARTNVYSRALRIFERHPLLGQMVYGTNEKLEFSYHSDVMDFLAYYGIIGGILLLVLVVLYVRQLLAIEHSDMWLAVLLLTGFVILAILNPVWYSPQVYAAVFMIPALISNLYNKSERT